MLSLDVEHVLKRKPATSFSQDLPWRELEWQTDTPPRDGIYERKSAASNVVTIGKFKDGTWYWTTQQTIADAAKQEARSLTQSGTLWRIVALIPE